MSNNEDAQGRPAVLYVEDDPLNILMMQALFDYRPMLNLLVATSGEDAIELASTLTPALLLLDIHLSDCNGADLLGRLRATASCRETPAIAVTSDQAFTTRGSGFCEVWHKPFLLFHTLARIDKRLLPRRSQTQPFQRVMWAAA